MYNIEMFKNIFGEAEILCMTDEFLESMSKLLDDKMSVRLLEFFDRFEKSGIATHTDNPVAVSLTKKVERIKEILWDRIRANTFHLEVINKGILDFASQLNIDTALYVIEERKPAIESLKWLMDNREFWTDYIVVRQKEDYENFLTQCQTLVHATRSLNDNFKYQGLDIELNRYDNLLVRIKANKEFFYLPNEKKRSTRMSRIMSQVGNLQIILHGLEYQEMCSERNIPKNVRKIFKP